MMLGLEFFEKLTSHFNFHVYDSISMKGEKIDPKERLNNKKDH